jgi:hypothetical protein
MKLETTPIRTEIVSDRLRARESRSQHNLKSYCPAVYDSESRLRGGADSVRIEEVKDVQERTEQRLNQGLTNGLGKTWSKDRTFG